MNYSEYPKVLTHPAHRAAVVAKWDPRKEQKDQPQGKPEAFPDLIVHSLDQEQEAASRGYAPAGVSDPEAYRRAMTNNEAQPAEKFVEYPKWLYHKRPNGEIESSLVQNKSEADDLGASWCATPDLARSYRAQEVKQDAQVVAADAPTRIKARRTRKSVGVPVS